jgi:hypothetical protein
VGGCKMNNQLIKELKKEIEVYELAIKTLKQMPEFNEEFEGTSICYTPIKQLERSLSNLYGQFNEELQK